MTARGGWMFDPNSGGKKIQPALQADYFGTRSYGTIFGLLVTIIAICIIATVVGVGCIAIGEQGRTRKR
jgi:hypothetical protein